MSLEVIEMMVKHEFADGLISDAEREMLLSQGEQMGVPKETTLVLIEAEMAKVEKNNAEKAEKANKDEAERNAEIQRAEIEKTQRKLEADAKQAIHLANKDKEKKAYLYAQNFSKWKTDFSDSTDFVLWISIFLFGGMALGLLNGYTHNKSWYMYVAMLFAGMFLGLIFFGLFLAISHLTKRKPLTDWHKPVLISFITVIAALILYLVIPF